MNIKATKDFLVWGVLAVVRFVIASALQICLSYISAVVILHLVGFAIASTRSVGCDINYLYTLRDMLGGKERIRLCVVAFVLLLLNRWIVVELWNWILHICMGGACDTNTYLKDSPLTIDDEDVLGRKSFEDRIIHLIKYAPVVMGAQYVGVWGDWGIGKTSCINRVEARLKKMMGRLSCPIFIRFDPLKYSGRRELTGAMFEMIAASRWMWFYGVSGVASCVGSRLVATKLKGLAEIHHWTTEIVGFCFSLFASQEQIQKGLGAGLARLNRRVVVVIDDLDRLPQREVCAMVRMLKSIGDLPNVVYLILANEPYLAAAVGSMVPRVHDKGIVDGRDFLKKMIFDVVELSEITEAELLVRYLRNCIKKFQRDYWLKFDIETCDHVYFAHHFLRNVRDVKRLVNAVHAALEELQSKDAGIGVSVDLGDLVVLEAVHMRWPDFYRILQRMYSTFLVAPQRTLRGIQVRSEYFKFVPPDDVEVVQSFLKEFLGIVPCQKPYGNLGKLELVWELRSPASYELYETYRLASEFCFENYFATNRPKKVIPRAQLFAAFEYIDSGNVGELTKSMLVMNVAFCLPEFLFVIEEKYRECQLSQGQTIFCALSLIADEPLKLGSLKCKSVQRLGNVYSRSLELAKGLLCKEFSGGKKLDLAELIERIDCKSCVLFSSLLYDEVERLANGGEMQFVNLEDICRLVRVLYDRIDSRMLVGACDKMPGASSALANISSAMQKLAIRTGGISCWRDYHSESVPAIEIIVLGVEDDERLKRTLSSVLTSIDSYQGIVNARVWILCALNSDARREMVDCMKVFFKGIDLRIQTAWPEMTYRWVTFIRSGDVVTRNWFPVLAFESFHFSVDIVSFNYYFECFEVMRYQHLKAMDHSVNVEPYVKKALKGNMVADSFWAKMYPSKWFNTLLASQCDDDVLRRVVCDKLFKCKKITHVDKGLLCHKFMLKDAVKNDKANRWLLSCRLVADASETIYSEFAVCCAIARIIQCAAWRILFFETLIHKRMVDEICPRKCSALRMKLLLCAHIPWIHKVFFPRYEQQYIDGETLI
ncbi:MAG: KAP family NTPase [Bacteroidales bacterium]|nr:KAP family NTPase [Bacteroidales bacterium]